MTTINATNPVGVFNNFGDAVSRDAPLYIAGTPLVAVPWRADRITTTITGTAGAAVQCPEDNTSVMIEEGIDTGSHTALIMTVYPYGTFPGTGSYASTPAANGATIDFDFYGTALGFTQWLYGSTIGYVSDEISCRIDGVAYPLDEILPVLPGYNSNDMNAQLRHLVASTDLPRGWHHCTLSVLSDPTAITMVWISALLLEPNEINSAAPAASVRPRVAATVIPNFVGTGAVSGTTLTISAVSSGTLTNAMNIGGPNIVGICAVSGTISGSGGVGTYTVSNSQTAASGQVMAFTAGINARGSTPATQGQGTLRFAVANNGTVAGTAWSRAHMANGPSETPEPIAVSAGDTRFVDAPVGHPWEQTMEFAASNSFMAVRQEILR